MPAYKQGNRWRWRCSVNGTRYGGSTPIGGNTKAVALDLERQHVNKVARRVHTGVMPTVAAFVVLFLEHQKARTAQLTNVGQTFHLDLHVVPQIGKLKLDDVTTRHLDELVTAWKVAGAGARTINTRLDTLRRMFAIAVEWRMLDVAPKVAKLPIAKKAPRFLSEDEARRVVDFAQPAWRSLILIGLRTGLRIGELRGLRWGDVDFARRTITVRRTDPGRGDMGPNAPKGKRERSVPLTNDAYTCLRDLVAAAKEPPRAELALWPGLPNRHGAARAVRSAHGCYGAIVAAAKAAGVPKVGPHTLRHTYASWLVMRGVSLRVVQELLGHSSMRQTEVYAHLAPGFAHHAAVQALDTPLVPPPETPALPPGDEDA